MTGASRGVGRGIALQLGEAGATVYITAREPSKSLSFTEQNLPSLESTVQGFFLVFFQILVKFSFLSF